MKKPAWLVILFCGLFFAPLIAEGKKKKKDKEPAASAAKEDTVEKVDCPKNPPKIPDIGRGDVYKNMPYSQGELAEYDVRYMGALAGTGRLEVMPPTKYKGNYKEPIYHRQFHGEAKTGDWYKLIFVAHDRLNALVRPWDHAISKFYMEQDEGKLMSARLQQKKWLEFDQEGCKVEERTTRINKKDKIRKFDLAYGTLDSFSVVYWLREKTFEIGKLERVLVYSSEKNWWLEANPLQFEKIKVAAGEFDAVKLQLHTYIGKELQQKGEVFVWFANKDPHKQLLMVKADIKIGSVWIELTKFTPGNS